MNTLGKDKDGRIWFKSDQHITDITDAYDFTVASSAYFGLWGRTWTLEAKFPNKDTSWNAPKFIYKTLGEYETAFKASLALDQIVTLKGIKPYDLDQEET